MWAHFLARKRLSRELTLFLAFVVLPLGVLNELNLNSALFRLKLGSLFGPVALGFGLYRNPEL